jgi:hypothetical protein
MLKMIFLYTVILGNLAWGYTLEQISLSNYEYRRYVRPQLKSISTDYQTLFFLINPHLKVFKESYRVIKEIYAEKKDIALKCHENFINDECFEIIKKIDSQINKLFISDYKIENVEIKNIDEKYMHYIQFQNYQNQVLSLKLHSNKLVFQKKYIDFNIFDYQKFVNSITDLYSVFNLYLLKSSFKVTKDEFTAYWNDFIRPVFEHILVNDDMKYFKHNITRFNVTWNVLNVKLTKRNIPLSKQVKTLLNIMHNRWNNILKVSLNTRG